MARRPKTIRNPYLDQLRVFLCFAVLLYHLGILKGEHLAVCGFFVLSGYLSTGSQETKKILLSDGLHLSEEGNILLSDAILEALVRP